MGTLARRASEAPIVRMSVTTTEGGTLTGRVMGQGFDDLQLRIQKFAAGPAQNEG